MEQWLRSFSIRRFGLYCTIAALVLSLPEVKAVIPTGMEAEFAAGIAILTAVADRLRHWTEDGMRRDG